ncbi:prepilin-type N-terminal cleavage/methylation domain-containing protein [Schinkia azotoformans MEV2011]|uniref:Prepilin-type N-terminal cleavage/methylation domain-containing protein n=1 Tax=Schinkia azotoformans MEV2011 TaxID=1348973 RepID=A0A072NP49_SCHAZ|nr:prepilin-type N-terminal cleavage/methylation domain-containing protein [Schinkia azotoformans]KEF39449.1 prepilin-type N-terminal cleavage/methylation domain-containing protein [Schinkia azotoformans MEV2011]MEC1696833.1 prepilin-type N-terminal cleavage/methylation domain-containing protein [Schinkia azotoformans]MEC1726634.1 prepilin-type N-terminal cleavage/methylation domain-containing protein [Schinkia azotoformans]MEC1780589.1 prepilin-type N-terminal cleavage/methylation domain-conta
MKITKLIRNPNGLTLLELLAVVVILGIISAIAVPTFSKIIENTKKDTHISNAIQIAEAAKMLVNTNTKSSDPESFLDIPITLETLISEGHIYPVKDPSINGAYYDQENTTVEISKISSGYQYIVKLVGNGLAIENAYTPNKDAYTLKREDITIP